MSRYEEMLQNPNAETISNYLTSGGVTTFYNSLYPEEELSFDHWMSSLGVAITVYGGYKMASSAKGAVRVQPSNSMVDDGISVNGFKSKELLETHYEKHFSEFEKAFENPKYLIENYLDDANYVIRSGEFVPELNGYIRFIKGKKYAFVGIDRSTGEITTFHIKEISELIKKAPSLGLGK